MAMTVQSPQNLSADSAAVLCSGFVYSPYEAWHVFDGNDTTPWYPEAGATAPWVGYHFSTAPDIRRTHWYNGWGGTYGYASTYEIEYGTDGTSWTSAYSGTASIQGWVTDDFTTVGNKPYWRIRATACPAGLPNWGSFTVQFVGFAGVSTPSPAPMCCFAGY